MISGLHARRGFTLVELLLSLVVSAIVGAALVRMVLAQGRFMDQQESWRQARSVSRSGINRLLSDLRAVENGTAPMATGGLEAAAAGGQDFTIRVPYAFGVICGNAANVYTISLLPVDNMMFTETGHSGFAVRNSAGLYFYHPGNAPVAGTTALCLNGVYDSIHTLPTLNGSPAGAVRNLQRTAGGAIVPAPPRGSIVFLYRRIRYEFRASDALPGRIGLFRTRLNALGANSEELATPFDNTARVNFYVGNNAVAQAAVPADLSTVRGLELVLNGASDRAPIGTAAPKTANMTTSVFFENRPD